MLIVYTGPSLHSKKHNMITTTSGPFHDNSANIIYQLLFCDSAEMYRPATGKPYGAPYDELFAAEPSPAALLGIISDNETDVRLKILACNELRALGYEVGNKDLFGVIVEIGLDEGLDVLASFSNGTARYINHSGKVLIWETTEDVKANELKDELFVYSRKVVQQIGPWDQRRKPHPRKGNVRISFLVADGLYFGEGPIDALFRDPLAGPVLNAATALMVYLTDMNLRSNTNQDVSMPAM
jgi:hypothetical protein